MSVKPFGFRYVETDEYKVGFSQSSWQTKHRLVILGQQRLFTDALAQALSVDFEVVASAGTLQSLRDADGIDLVIIDIDRIEISKDELREIDEKLFQGATLCLLSLFAPPHVFCFKAKPCFTIPKTIAGAAFVDTLRDIAARVRIVAAIAARTDAASGPGVTSGISARFR